MPWLMVAAGYLLGSLPTAYIAGRVLIGVDIRYVGDKNTGAANVYRQLSPAAGIAVGLIDAGKGAMAVLLAWAFGLGPLAIVFTGVAAVIGHNWPVFTGFRGGRGVSTTVGVLLVLLPLPMLILAGPALLVLIIRRSVTLACVLLFVPLAPVVFFTGGDGLDILISLVLPCLVGFTHFLRVGHSLEYYFRERTEL